LAFRLALPCHDRHRTPRRIVCPGWVTTTSFLTTQPKSRVTEVPLGQCGLKRWSASTAMDIMAPACWGAPTRPPLIGHTMQRAALVEVISLGGIRHCLPGLTVDNRSVARTRCAAGPEQVAPDAPWRWWPMLIIAGAVDRRRNAPGRCAAAAGPARRPCRPRPPRSPPCRDRILVPPAATG
jgi:hypothetical protein